MAKKPMARSEEFKTPTCRLSFAQSLFEARKVGTATKAKFGCTLIFKNEHKAALGKLVMDTATAEWPNAAERFAAGLLKSPLLKGDGKEARNKETGELHGGMGPDVFFIRPFANEDSPPVVRWKSETIPATPREVYPGCEGFAVLNAFCYPSTDGGLPGVGLGILYFQKTGEGEPLGSVRGPVDAGKYFEKVADGGGAPEETKTGAGAGGLFGD